MPPRKKKPAFGGAGGGALQSLGGAFRSKGKKSKAKEVAVVVGGLVNTLGWLWKDSKPIPKNPPKPDADEDDEYEDDQLVRSLPAFIKLSLIAPGSGSEFRKTDEQKNFASFEVSANLRISEFRTRLMDFFGEWQELKPTQDDVAKAANKARKSKAAAVGGPDGKIKNKTEAKPFRHKAPLPQKLITGRHVWSNQTKIGDVVTYIGGGGGDGTGDGESMHAFLPWSGHGTELMRYGPVVIVLIEAELDVPPITDDDTGGGSSESRPTTAGASRPPTSFAQSKASKTMKKSTLSVQPVRTATTWFASNGEAHLVPQKPIHLISDSTSDAVNKTNNRAAARVAKSIELKNRSTLSKKVAPDFEVMTTAIKSHEPLGLDHARVDLKAVNLHDVRLSQAQ